MKYSISSFSLNLSALQKASIIIFLLCFIQVKGQTIQRLSPYKDGLAVAAINNKIGFINPEGAFTTPALYNAAYTFNEGLAAVMKDGKWGFIDKNGKEKISFSYYYVTPFFGVTAVACDEKSCFYIDKNGSKLNWGSYKEISPFFQNTAFVRTVDFPSIKNEFDRDYKIWKKINRSGQLIRNQTYSINEVAKALSIPQFESNRKQLKYFTLTGEVENIFYVEQPVPRAEELREVGSYDSNKPEANASSSSIPDGLHTERKNNKTGLLNFQTIIIPFQYDNIIVNHALSVCTVVNNAKSGLFNYLGQQILPCIYDDIKFIYGNENHNLVVSSNKKKALFTLSGKKLLNFDYDDITTRGIGSKIFLLGQKSTQSNLMDFDGKELLPCFSCVVDVIQPINEGYIVEHQKKRSFFDLNFKQVTGFIFDHLWAFNSTGLAQACKNGLWGFIDISGKEVIPFIHSNLTYSGYSGQKNSLVELIKMEKDKRFGYYDKTGKLVVPFKYSDAGEFNEGMACVQIPETKKALFIDTQGNPVIEGDFSFINNKITFQNGQCLVRSNKDNKFGMINKKGGFLIPAKYDLLGDKIIKNRLLFAEACDSCPNQYKFGFLNQKGEVVIPAQFELAGDFDDGKAMAQKNGNLFYIDVNGNCIKDCP